MTLTESNSINLQPITWLQFWL